MCASSVTVRQVREHMLPETALGTDSFTEVSRGFGFLKFPSIDLAKAFLERNFPSIYLYGRDSADNDSQAAKVRIDFSRERDERPRGDKEGEWTCKIVCFASIDPYPSISQLTAPSALLSTSLEE